MREPKGTAQFISWASWWCLSVIKLSVTMAVMKLAKKHEYLTTMSSNQNIIAYPTRKTPFNNQANAPFHILEKNQSNYNLYLVTLKDSKYEASLKSETWKKKKRKKDQTRQKADCTRKRRESMMMIMMSHDAYTHQKSKSFSSLAVEMTTPRIPSSWFWQNLIGRKFLFLHIKLSGSRGSCLFFLFFVQENYCYMLIRRW